MFSGVSKIGKSMTQGVTNIDVLGGIKNVGSLDIIGGIKNMNNKLLNLFNDENGDELSNNFGSASDYKQKYLSKYGVSFTIPSLYVQSSAWYPNNPTFFVQIVNTVVPSGDEYEVHTHYWEKNKDKSVNKFEDIFKDKIKGCTIRLIKTEKDLTNISIIDSFVFDEVPRLDKLRAEFSIDGKYLVIYSRENQFARVFEVNRIEDIIKEIRNQKQIIYLKGKEDIQEISFGNNQIYMILKYSQKLEIYHIQNLIAQGEGYQPEVFELAKDQLECISDFFFWSHLLTETYTCYLACKVVGLKKIKVFNVMDLHKEKIWEIESNSINFFEEVSDNFMLEMNVLVDQNLINTIFVNGNEQFTISMNEKTGETSQMQLTQLGSKKIIFMSLEKYNDFTCYLIASNDYDDALQVYRADDIDYNFSILRDVQPNIIKVFDICFDSEGTLNLLSMCDDEFIIDQISYKHQHDDNAAQKLLDESRMVELGGNSESEDHEEKHRYPQTIKRSYIFSSVRAFFVNWPYVCFSGLENYLFVVNVYDRKSLHRVATAKLNDTIQVCQTFITNTKDLFIVIKKKNKFIVMMLDLDLTNAGEGEVDEANFKFKTILEYPASDVNGCNLNSMFVRGSSRKEVITLNQQLLIFLLHGQKLYAYIEGGEKKLICVNPQQSRRILSYDLVIQDDNNFFFLQNSMCKRESVSQICQVSLSFSDFLSKVVISEDSPQFDFIEFKIDKENQMLIVFLNEKAQESRKKMFIKVLDLNDLEKVILDCEIVNQEMKGIFLSGLYKLVDGHIYYDNKVIKLRYDLMKSYGANGLNQEIYFNQYKDILMLEDGETIKTNMPMESIQNHRLAYVILNKKVLMPKKLMITPYLHERRIYLNRMKQNTFYFYTSKQQIIENEESKTVISYIFSFNVNENKFYVYSEKGLLLNRIDFSDYIKKYGEIVCASSNGLNFALHNKRTDQVTIIRFDVQKVSLLKTFTIESALNEFLNSQKGDLADLRAKSHWIQTPSRGSLNYLIKINNKADIMILISRKYGAEKEGECVYFFQANFKLNKNMVQELDPDFSQQCRKDYSEFKEEKDFAKLSGQNLLVSKGKKNFMISQDKFFIWTNHRVQYYDFKHFFNKENKEKLRFLISKDEKFSFIKNVITSDGSDTLGIVVEQVQCSLVISWSLEKDLENTAFEVQKDLEIILAQNGEFLILTDDQTTLTEQKCNLKCFKINRFSDLQKTVACDGLGYHNGYRFDSDNHNWIIMKHYICLSFSYMSFVIQSEIEKIEVNDYAEPHPLLDKSFDMEAFSYMLNKNSCFTSGNLTKDNFLKLQIVLNKLRENGTAYLEILHYHIEQKMEEEEEPEMLKMFGGMKTLMMGENKSMTIYKSALHQAFKEGNNRVIDIILANMALIEINNSAIFSQILPELTDIQSFSVYLQNLPTQTFQMQEKKVLRIQEPLNESIIAMATSHTAYVDEDFYTKKFGESKHNSNFKAFPCNIVSLPIGWIISTPEGKEFLQAILQSERLDFYEIKSLQIIIEFLYQKSKYLLLRYLLPLYMIQGGVFVIAIILQEIRIKQLRGQDVPMSPKQLESFSYIIILLNQIMTFVMVGIMVRVAMFTGKSFFQRVFTWFDVAFYSLNTIANQYALLGDELKTVKSQRILQSFGILFFLAKNFYFMKLVDQIAPLIDIIIQVVIDIKWFMFIFVACLFCFGFSFNLLGSNQLEYDNIESEEDIDSIQYQTLSSSFMFMWDTCLGGGGSESFNIGDGSQSKYLYILYISAQFILLIHLLNMLIAIMGETFGNRNEVAEQIKIRDHLAFVIDNWYLKDFSLGDIKQINYIITAFAIEETEDDNEILNNLQSGQDQLRTQIEGIYEEITKKQRKQEQYLRRLEQDMKIQEQSSNKQVKLLQNIMQSVEKLNK